MNEKFVCFFFSSFVHVLSRNRTRFLVLFVFILSSFVLSFPASGNVSLFYCVCVCVCFLFHLTGLNLDFLPSKKSCISLEIFSHLMRTVFPFSVFGFLIFLYPLNISLSRLLFFFSQRNYCFVERLYPKTDKNTQSGFPPRLGLPFRDTDHFRFRFVLVIRFQTENFFSLSRFSNMTTIIREKSVVTPSHR